jgi:hypothetical protein
MAGAAARVTSMRMLALRRASALAQLDAPLFDATRLSARR